MRGVKLAVMAAIVVAILAACSSGSDSDSAEEIAAADRALLVGNSPVAIAVGGGGVWVVDDEEKSLRRFTVNPLRSAGPPLGLAGTPVDVSASAGGVFVAVKEPSKVLRIDPKTGGITGQANLSGEPVSVDVGDREVYVVTKDPNDLIRIDRRTGEVIERPLRLPFEPSFVSARDFAVWVGSEKAKRIARIDQRTGAVRRSFRVPNGLTDIATGDGGTLWFAQGDDFPFGHVPIEGDYVELDDPEDSDGSYRVAVGPRGGVYVVASQDRRTSSGSGSSSSRTYYIREGLVVDPKNGDVRSVFEVSDDLRDIAAGAGAVWTIEPATGNVPSGSWRVSRHPIG